MNKEQLRKEIRKLIQDSKWTYDLYNNGNKLTVLDSPETQYLTDQILSLIPERHEKQWHAKNARLKADDYLISKGVNLDEIPTSLRKGHDGALIIDWIQEMEEYARYCRNIPEPVQNQHKLGSEQVTAEEWLEEKHDWLYQFLKNTGEENLKEFVSDLEGYADKRHWELYDGYHNLLIEKEQFAQTKGRESVSLEDKCTGCGNEDGFSSISLVCENGTHEFTVCRVCGLVCFPDEMYKNNPLPSPPKETESKYPPPGREIDTSGMTEISKP